MHVYNETNIKQNPTSDPPSRKLLISFKVVLNIGSKCLRLADTCLTETTPRLAPILSNSNKHHFRSQVYYTALMYVIRAL